MSKEAKPNRSPFAKVKRGSSLRVEIHLSNFCAFTMALDAREVGELQHMLMLEAVGHMVPASSRACVQAAWERRDLYRRIRGGFGRVVVSLATRRAVYERDGRKCAYCAKDISWTEYHCDHVEPASRGGSNDPENLRASCVPCNLAKAAKLLEDWQPQR